MLQHIIYVLQQFEDLPETVGPEYTDHDPH